MWKRWAIWAVLAAGWVGCASPPKAPAWRSSGDPLADGEHAFRYGPARDRVLWAYRTGLAALRQGKFDLAKQYFDPAIARISTIYGPDKDARKARSYFHEEAKKTFIGEPYERVMAYFYRGILYWRDGEPDNARACFRSAAVMDVDPDNQEAGADYVLLDYLDAYITERLGGDASELYQRADSLARAWKPPRFSPQANVLVFVDYGPGPIKYATGQYAEQLRFRCEPARVRSALVKVAGVTGKAVPYDDLCYQATTRSGRVMDYVLANKAVFKQSTDAGGDVAIVGGAILATTQRDQAQLAGLAMLGAGVISKILSASTKPAADTRAWDNLPQYLSFVAFELPPGPHTLTVEFLDSAQQPIGELTKTVQFEAPASGPAKVLYVSDKSVTPQTQ
jgi:tetratricopeptide (TPR) repeat protein